MAKTYVKVLQEQIESLEDGFELKDVELYLLESELQETLSPYKLLSEQNGYFLDMLNEIIEFEKKKPSDRVTASKKRLLNLLHLNTLLTGIVNYNNTLKTCNKLLIGKIQLLRLKNAELNKELTKIRLSNEF